ncbi:hypothetical protein WA158_001594 [Blastocystis sp. Blastoise]
MNKLVLKTFHTLKISQLCASLLRSLSTEQLFEDQIDSILKKQIGDEVKVHGWVKTMRIHKNVGFITIVDGSNPGGIQCVIDDIDSKDISLGCSMELCGTLTKPFSSRHPDPVELKTTAYTVIGKCDPQEYPLQAKHNPIEYLRTIPHVRARSPYYSSMFRVRDSASFAVHEYLRNQGFFYVHTPIITSNDCEGAGETFSVIPSSDISTSLSTIKSLENTSKTSNEMKNISSSSKDIYTKMTDFFKSPAFLTVSGQLQAEMLASSLSRVYTFGPTFRAENSNTTRHLSEFWMIEPEVMWTDLTGIQKLAQGCVQSIINKVLNECPKDIQYFDKLNKDGLLKKLETTATTEFCHLSYTEAITVLEKHNNIFKFPVTWGIDLQTEHEKYLTDIYCNGIPVFIYDYPKTIKPFYMKVNTDNKTVQATDLLVPKIGELIGGSVREENYDALKNRMIEFELLDKKKDGSDAALQWYLDLRKYGSVPHGGWGMGFERLMLYLTGASNIRDVIPVPRAPHTCQL